MWHWSTNTDLDTSGLRDVNDSFVLIPRDETGRGVGVHWTVNASEHAPAEVQLGGHPHGDRDVWNTRTGE